MSGTGAEMDMGQMEQDSVSLQLVHGYVRLADKTGRGSHLHIEHSKELAHA